MAAAWLNAGSNPSADLNYDDKIDNVDSDILAANWGLVDVGDELPEVHFYYHYDGLGSVVAISDEQALLAEKYEYSVYGRVHIMAPNGQSRSASIVGNPSYFTGRRLDGETGLYYYRAGYYSPEIGRFAQTDPIGYSDVKIEIVRFRDADIPGAHGRMAKHDPRSDIGQRGQRDPSRFLTEFGAR